MMQWLQTAASIDVNAPTMRKPFLTMLHAAAAGGHMAAVKWLAGQSADVRLLSGHTPPVRASELAEINGHTAIAAYLREQEQAADARDHAEAAAAAEAEQAAVRRARNERRRQKLKKARARRRSAGGSGVRGEEEEEEEEEKEEQELAAAMAGLSAGDGAAAAGGEEEAGAEAAVAEEQQPPAAPAPAAAAATDSEEQDMLEAAAVSSLSVVARPPHLEEYLDVNAPDRLLCPISMALLDDPVVLVADGNTYSRAAIEQHFAFCRERGKPLTAPKTNMEITDATGTILVPNVLVREEVLDYKAAKERAWAEAERRWREAGGEGVN